MSLIRIIRAILSLAFALLVVIVVINNASSGEMMTVETTQNPYLVDFGRSE